MESYGVGAAHVKDTQLHAKVAQPNKDIHFTLEPAQSTFPVRKGNADLLKALNANIAQLRESGRLAEILETHGLEGEAANPGEPRLFGD